MKTLVRFLIVAGMVFTAVFLASSCDDDDKDDQTTIIGTWQLAESKVTVTPIATATDSKDKLEADLGNFLKIDINAKATFNNKQVSFPYSLKGVAKTATFDYTLNGNTLSIVLGIDSPSTLLADVDLKDNTLKLSLKPESYLNLLKYFAQDDADLQATVNQISQASVYYRFNRVN